MSRTLHEHAAGKPLPESILEQIRNESPVADFLTWTTPPPVERRPPVRRFIDEIARRRANVWAALRGGEVYD